jgi:hypothetical protein
MITAGNRARIWARHVAAGFFVAFVAAFSITLVDMAHEHEAISVAQRPMVSWVIIVLEWPVLLLDRPVLHAGHMFYHSHVQGVDFWYSLSEFIFVNGAGWTVLFLVGAAAVRRLLSFRAIWMRSKGSSPPPETPPPRRSDTPRAADPRGTEAAPAPRRRPGSGAESA